MKLLRIKSRNFKNCKDDFTIDFVAKSKKTEEDKTYELQEIAPNLYTFNTVAIIGKNASGKSTAISLLICCYGILENFRISNNNISYDNTELDITFYHEGYVYNYTTTLKDDTESGVEIKTIFTDQMIVRKKYTQTNIKNIFDFEHCEKLKLGGELPDDISYLFFVLKKRKMYAISFDGYQDMALEENTILYALNIFNSSYLSNDLFRIVLSIFDNNINDLEKIDDHHYELTYKNNKMQMSDKELMYFLSSGTIKGISVYTSMIISLYLGVDLIIDEIENHFHNTLVENMISLYKDPDINKNHASLIFSTHYCELLDLFRRQDNIWITKSDERVYTENMYEHYNLRSDSLKSKHFYNNTFNTAVNYNALMNLKKELKRGLKK